MIEFVVYKVRPKNGDKRIRVFRVLFDYSDSFREQHESFLEYLSQIFPYGFYLNNFERHLIDYSVVKHPGLVSFHYDVIEHCNHDYLAQYLTSTDDLEN